NDWVEAANVQVRALARELGVPLADVEMAFLSAGNPPSLFVDHVHPAAAGEELIAGAFFQAIAHGSRTGTAFTGPVTDGDAPQLLSRRATLSGTRATGQAPGTRVRSR